MMPSHRPFEDYCRERWGFTRSRAHRLIEASEIVRTLPNGNMPANEAQARPLTRLDTPEEQREAGQQAVETAPRDEETGEPIITASHVEHIREDVMISNTPPTTNDLPWASPVLLSRLAEGAPEARRQGYRLIYDWTHARPEYPWIRILGLGPNGEPVNTEGRVGL